MSRPAVVLDACVLIPIRLATTLLWLADAGLFQPLWSARLLDEVERNLPRLGVAPAQAARRVDSMRGAFGAEAMVEGFDDLIEAMTCHPKDRHVLAAAAHEHADAVVTFNLKDFPASAADPHGIEVLHPDTFLLQLLGSRPLEAVAALDVGIRDLRKPPETVMDWLRTLTSTVPVFANLAADLASEPPAPLGPLPALVTSGETSVLAASCEPSDLTDPAQVALGWWSGLLGDRDLARALTDDPLAWGDYQWAVEHVAGRSLASRGLAAVDALDRIAYFRFVPEVAQASRTFAPFLTAMTFMTLVKTGDGTWRVWGLGPAMPSASEVLGS